MYVVPPLACWQSKTLRVLIPIYANVLHLPGAWLPDVNYGKQMLSCLVVLEDFDRVTRPDMPQQDLSVWLVHRHTGVAPLDCFLEGCYDNLDQTKGQFFENAIKHKKLI